LIKLANLTTYCSTTALGAGDLSSEAFKISRLPDEYLK
jgi:hypothetical protein